jgi:hypothetical protein
MFRPNTSILSASLTALVLSLTPSAAHASPKHATRSSRVARVVAPRPCSKRPVEVVAGKESATFALAKCDGSADPDGVDQLSLLARPAGTSKPKESLTALAKSRGPELAPGILRVDPRLVERLELVADQFRKAGEHEHIVLGSVAGRSEPGSHPGMVRSLDFRIGGVKGEAVASFCKTLPDTTCGPSGKRAFLRMELRGATAADVGDAEPKVSPQPGADPAAPARSETGRTLAPLPEANRPAAASMVKPAPESERFF